MKKPSTRDWTGRTLFGKWTVMRLIGIGGTSTVLEARHRNGRRAALKVLHPHLAEHGHARERFLREGRLANLVNHPGVVAVLDDFMTEDGTAVLVLELVEGESLAARAKAMGGVLGVREVLDAASAVLEVLAVAHDASVIHRDIKPENILVRAAGGYKLADFGLAGLSHELGMLTGTNASLGTPAYMSPEQARGESLTVDARTDLWSLGATMFTLLTSRFVHGDSAQGSLVVAAATKPAPSILTVAPELQADLAEVIDRALCSDREERFPNARSMHAALAKIDATPGTAAALVPIATDAPTAATSPSLLNSWTRAAWRTSQTGERRRLFGWLMAAAAATLAGFVIWFRSSAGAPEPTPMDGADSRGTPARLRSAPATAPVVSVVSSGASSAPVVERRVAAPSASAKPNADAPPRRTAAKPLRQRPPVETAPAADDEAVMDRRK